MIFDMIKFLIRAALVLLMVYLVYTNAKEKKWGLAFLFTVGILVMVS